MSANKSYVYVNIENILECVVLLTKKELKLLKKLQLKEVDLEDIFSDHCGHHTGKCLMCKVTEDEKTIKIKEIKILENCNIEVNASSVHNFLTKYDWNEI